MMQVAKRVPFEDPNVLNACRGLYLLSNLIIMGIYLYIRTKIDAKKGQSSSASQTPGSSPRGPLCFPDCC